MKKIITHRNPDLDAIACVWILRHYLPGWEEAKADFISSGDALKKGAGVDQDPEVLWVDVGHGRLDHHQTGEYLSAMEVCFVYIKEKRKNQPLRKLDEKALERMIKVVTEIDNARDIRWPEAIKDRYLFYLYNLIEGLGKLSKTDEQTVNFGLMALDSILCNLKQKIRAEEELEKGIRFKTPWGKAIGLNSSSSKQVLWLGQIKGYILAVGKDPKSGAVRIYARPGSKVDLTKAYNKVRKLDPKADWFLHATKTLLLNQSSVNPGMKPTKLTLEDIIRILEKG
jgi:hypothetical protein